MHDHRLNRIHPAASGWAGGSGFGYRSRAENITYQFLEILAAGTQPDVLVVDDDSPDGTGAIC